MDTKSVTIKSISISGVVMGIISLVAGLAVLVGPDLVRWIVGVFLIVWGVVAIINKKQSPQDHTGTTDHKEEGSS